MSTFCECGQAKALGKNKGCARCELLNRLALEALNDHIRATRHEDNVANGTILETTAYFAAYHVKHRARRLAYMRVYNRKKHNQLMAYELQTKRQ